ncbi:6116_t:CDS:2 [Dentiscutata erythropus]|uniref:6116_t:CDS:1 n=1 Tax=Dentiscutata erythropus TaxID=1348616 RepID=A0A9N9CBV2_9GLOM|nr:6116_t:CDS:2 [Dentiscutata erythropus]
MFSNIPDVFLFILFLFTLALTYDSFHKVNLELEMIQSILSENIKYLYFILICLITLWHKIDSTSRTEAKKIEAIFALNNEIRNDITGIRNDITGICNNITGIHNDITGIRNEITGMHNDITGIHNDINRIRGTSNFGFACLFILYHKINSISQTEPKKIEAILALTNEIPSKLIQYPKLKPKKIEAILALTNEIRDNINKMHNTSRIEHKKIISDLSINVNRICETSKKENEEIGKTISDLISDLRKNFNEIREAEQSLIFQAVLNQFSNTKSISTRQISSCNDTETLRSKFKSLVDQRTERDRLSFPGPVLKALTTDIDLHIDTLAKFYLGLTKPHTKTLKEISGWVDEETKRNNNKNIYNFSRLLQN